VLGARKRVLFLQGWHQGRNRIRERGGKKKRDGFRIGGERNGPIGAPKMVGGDSKTNPAEGWKKKNRGGKEPFAVQ